MFTKVTNPGARLLVRAFASTQSRTTNPFTTTKTHAFRAALFPFDQQSPSRAGGSIVLVLKKKKTTEQVEEDNKRTSVCGRT
jgi:hypothetical protein